jgi:hypothetical protein
MKSEPTHALQYAPDIDNDLCCELVEEWLVGNIQEDKRIALVPGDADRLFLGADATLSTPGDTQHRARRVTPDCGRIEFNETATVSKMVS